MFSKYFAHLGCLECKFTCWYEEKGLNFVLVDIDLLEGGDNEGCCFACTVLCTGKDITFRQGDWDGFFLNRRWFFETGFEDAHEEFTAEGHFLKFDAFSGRYIFCLWSSVFWWWSKTGFP